MEEECFIIGLHHSIEKKRKKSWHDHHIMIKPFKGGGLVLLYDSNFFKYVGKLKTHWLGPYLTAHITDMGAIKLYNIDGTYVIGMVNGSFLKPYYDSHNILS